MHFLFTKFLQFDYLTRHKTVQRFLIGRCWCNHKSSKRATRGVLSQLPRVHHQTVIQILKRMHGMCERRNEAPTSNLPPQLTLMKPLMLLDMIRMFGTVAKAAKCCASPESRLTLSDDGFNG